MRLGILILDSPSIDSIWFSPKSIVSSHGNPILPSSWMIPGELILSEWGSKYIGTAP